MKNNMTITEIRRHFDIRNRREAKRDEARKERHRKMFEAAEAVGCVCNDEIYDFGPEC